MTEDSQSAPRDIEELQRLRARVKELEAQLEGEAVERFQPNLLDNIGDAVFITDMEFHIQYWNSAAEALYGWEAREVLGKEASEVLESRASSSGDAFELGATPPTSIWKGELFRRAKNGEWLLVQSKVSILTDEAGEPVGLITIHRDVSEQRKMEKALQMSERRFRQIFQAGPVGMMLLDEGGVLVHANPHFCQMLGYSEIELIGSHHLEITHSDDFEPEATLMRRLLTGATPGYQLAKRCIHKEGHVVWVQIHTTLLRDDQGRLGHVLGIVEDITQKREAEKQLRLFQSFMASAEIPVLWHTLDGEIRFVNEAACRLLGHTLEELEGQTVRDIYGFHSVANWEEMLHTLQVQGSMIVEMELARKDGKVIPIMVNANYMVHEGEGQVFIFLTDVSGRMAAQRALESSEQRYRRIVETAQEGIWWIDADAKTVFANRRMAEMLGTTIEALQVASPFDFIADEYRDTLADNLDRRRQGFSDHYESLYRRTDGSRLWVWMSTNPIFDEAGNYLGSLGMMTDITELRQADEERRLLLSRIQEQAIRLTQIINTVPGGVALISAEGRVMMTNPFSQRFLELMGDAQEAETLARVDGLSLQELLEKSADGDWIELNHEGEVFEVICKLLHADKPEEGFLLVIRDMTRARDLQERASEQERLAAVGQLAAGIAHDFNNIMAVVTLYSSMTLRDERLPLQIRDRMEIIRQQSSHASDLIQQILDFARSSLLDRLEMDLLPMVKEMTKLLDRTLPENIEIRWDAAPGAYEVHADPTRIRQALMNLALNSRDAMPEGGRLTFELERMRFSSAGDAPIPELVERLENEPEKDEWVHISVKDTGTGIPEEILPRIYEPFFTTKETGKGSGLGLAQVYGIVKQHHGEVAVASNSFGTSFSIYLPASGKAEQQIEKVWDVDEIVTGNGELILLVEDDPSTRGALADTLDLLNYQVLSATNGKEALEIYAQHEQDIDMVLTDYIMPVMGGKELFHTLREQGSEVRMMVLTGHPLEEELESLVEEGLNGWLMKVPSLAGLAQAIAQVLGS